jgi:HTH-type transcriptional regulator/antitoxin HipB
MPVITDSAQVGALLVARRKALKLSQTQVAQRLGLSQNRVSELETKPATLTLAQLLAFAAALGVSLAIDVASKPPQ